MINFFNKKTLGGLVIAGLLIAAPFSAFAADEQIQCGVVTGSFLKCASDAFEWITQQVGYILAAITAQLLTFAAYFIQVMIKLSGTGLTSPGVTEGFKI